MSFVITAPEMVASAASDLASLGSMIGEAHAAAVVPTTAVMAAAGDEVSAAIASLFSSHAQQFQALSAEAAAFHAQFVQALNAAGVAYTVAEAATRCSAAPMPSRSQSWPSSHAPPKRRESQISISPVCAAIACAGSRNREIEATSRASASRSTASARPKLWITFAEGTPVTGWRSLCASCRYDTVDP